MKGWARLRRAAGGGELELIREAPPFWREFRQHHWLALDDGRLVAPPLAQYARGRG